MLCAVPIFSHYACAKGGRYYGILIARYRVSAPPSISVFLSLWEGGRSDGTLRYMYHSPIHVHVYTCIYIRAVVITSLVKICQIRTPLGQKKVCTHTCSHLISYRHRMYTCTCMCSHWMQAATCIIALYMYMHNIHVHVYTYVLQ